jgi:hypothetical protein
MWPRKSAPETQDCFISGIDIPNNVNLSILPLDDCLEYDGTDPYDLEEWWEDEPASPKSFADRFNKAREEYDFCQQEEADLQPEVAVEDMYNYPIEDEDIYNYPIEDEDMYRDPLGHDDYRYLYGYPIDEDLDGLMEVEYDNDDTQYFDYNRDTVYCQYQTEVKQICCQDSTEQSDDQ